MKIIMHLIFLVLHHEIWKICINISQSASQLRNSVSHSVSSLTWFQLNNAPNLYLNCEVLINIKKNQLLEEAYENLPPFFNHFTKQGQIFFLHFNHNKTAQGMAWRSRHEIFVEHFHKSLFCRLGGGGNDHSALKMCHAVKIIDGSESGGTEGKACIPHEFQFCSSCSISNPDPW